jgi:adenylate kinase
MNLILLGPPGAGKGTQSKLIEDRFNLRQLSSGDMLRAAVANQTEVGKSAQVHMDAGHLVPDDVVVGVVLETIEHLPATVNGFILDGFPRTAQQAQALDVFLQKRGETLDWAIVIDVSDDLLVSRVTGRFTCSNCGEGYHDLFKLPATLGVCDRCGSTSFRRRADDNEETVRQRLDVYHRETKPLIDYYRAKGRLRVIDGEMPIEKVADEIDSILREERASAVAR